MSFADSLSSRNQLIKPALVKAKLRWGISLIFGLSATVGYTNQFTEYWIWSQSDLVIWCIYAVVFFTVVGYGLVFGLTWPQLDKHSRWHKLGWGILSLLMGGLLVMLTVSNIPINPPFATPSILEITATGQKNERAAASDVWVEKIETGKGQVIPADALEFVGDWSAEGGLPRSTQQSQLSVLRWSGFPAGGLTLTLGSHPGSGVAVISWNGHSQTVDLYNEAMGQKQVIYLPQDQIEQPLTFFMALYGAYTISLGLICFIATVWLAAVASKQISPTKVINRPTSKSRILAKALLIISIVFLYSLYSFAYAQHVPALADNVMIMLFFLAGATLFFERPSLPSKNVTVLYLCFLGLSGASVFFSASEYADVNWLGASVTKLLLSSVIVFGFLYFDKKALPLLKWGLFICLIILLGAILFQQIIGMPIKEIFPEFNEFKVVFNEWNQKYYSFWLLFLFWATVSFFGRNGKFNTSVVISIGLLTGYAIFTGYSDSAKMAFVFSAVVFALAHIKSKLWFFSWNLLTYLYVFTFPLIWLLFDTIGWLDQIKTIESLNNVIARVEIYSASVNALLDQWFLGYGFGSTLSLLPLIASFETGGHPHNIVLLFWLELGIFGAFLLAAVITILLSFIHSNTDGLENGPSSWALFASGLVIFSFSFDIWTTDVVLTYSMWLAMIMLSSQHTKSNRLNINKSNLSLFHYSVLTVTITGMVSYLINALLLM